MCLIKLCSTAKLQKVLCNNIYLLVVANCLLIVPRKLCLFGKMSELNRTQLYIAHRVVVVF